MKSLWNDAEAATFRGELGLRVYTSRLLGQDKSLVLHGGGNTSLKHDDTLFVKATGSDLARVDESMFCALRLARARELLERDPLTNAEMMELLDPCLIRHPGPRPSIETLMHAILPFRYVEHTHADSVLAVINTENGERISAAVYGNLAPLVPYRHSGVDLARACMHVLQERGTRQTLGLLLQFHGVVAFGESARASYDNMIRLVSLAEDYLRANGAWDIPLHGQFTHESGCPAPAAFYTEAAGLARFPLAVHRIDEPLCSAFMQRDDLPVLSQWGPSTPQHAVYTKRVPQLGWDVEAFAARYADYLIRTLGRHALERIDPAPRIVIDPTSGVFALGVDDDAARVAAEFYLHDMEVMMRASAHDRYRAAPEHAIAQAELEYGGFETKIREQARLRGGIPPQSLQSYAP
jgi:rhamnose utilization protein RhaD (predicted bifunctional aldolase and dehydrogenase)